METRLTGYRVDESGDIQEMRVWRISAHEVVNFDTEDLEQMRTVDVFHTMTIGANFFLSKSAAAHAAMHLLIKEENRLVEQKEAVGQKIENIIREFPEVMRES